MQNIFNYYKYFLALLTFINYKTLIYMIKSIKIYYYDECIYIVPIIIFSINEFINSDDNEKDNCVLDPVGPKN